MLNMTSVNSGILPLLYKQNSNLSVTKYHLSISCFCFLHVYVLYQNTSFTYHLWYRTRSYMEFWKHEGRPTTCYIKDFKTDLYFLSVYVLPGFIIVGCFSWSVWAWDSESIAKVNFSKIHNESGDSNWGFWCAHSSDLFMQEPYIGR